MTETRSAGVMRDGAGPRWAWIFNARADLTIALCWIPIFLAAHALSVQTSLHSDQLLNTLLSGAFLLSLVHQPLTLALVYGDRQQFELRRTLFTWSPPVAIGLIVVAVVMNLWIIVPIAAVWNTIHTLQQRYGLSRIYGRKAGYGSARLDRAVLYSWMGAALLVVGSSPKVLDQVARVMLDSRNSQAVVSLSGVRPYALVVLIPAMLIAAGTLVALVRQERRHLHDANAAKWMYQGSSLLLIAAIAFDPLAGFIAYVAAHAIEYVIVVYKTMQHRYSAPRQRWPLLGRAAHTRTGRVAFFAAFCALFFLFDAKAQQVISGRTYDIIVYSIGILHFWYDGFIWKLRKPVVAENFGIRTPVPV